MDLNGALKALAELNGVKNDFTDPFSVMPQKV